MIKPEDSNIVSSRLRLACVFPHMPAALISALKRANAGGLLPGWREDQLVKFTESVALYATDLNNAYNDGRVDVVGMVGRNLAELDVWVRYCNLSMEHARRFLEDSLRDYRDIWETLQKGFTGGNQQTTNTVAQLLRSFEQIAASCGVDIVGRRYKQVHHAAEEVGRRAEFNTANKIFSKVVHPTSLVLTFGHEHEALGSMIGPLYVGSVDFAVGAFYEIAAFVQRIFGMQDWAGDPGSSSCPS